MKTINAYLRSLFIIVLCIALFGCEGGGDGSASQDNDTGDNNPNLVYAVGDSITQGVGGATPYPNLLSPLIGKTVVNSGVGGQRSGAGVNVAKSALTRKPGYILIMYGTNDIILGGASQANIDAVINNLSRMVNAARAQSTIPIVGTVVRGIKSHEVYDPGFLALNQAIRAYAGSNGVKLVDIETALGNDPSVYQNDGLHPTSAGNQIIAEAFASRF
jgi:lysophospholipase L1-like esterase